MSLIADDLQRWITLS